MTTNGPVERDGDRLELSGGALAGFGGAATSPTPGWLRVETAKRPRVESFDFGQCEARRVVLPPFDGWRPPPLRHAHREDAVVAILHLTGALRFRNVDGEGFVSGPTLIVSSYFPEAEFKSLDSTDRIALRLPAKVLPCRARQVMHPFLSLDPSEGLPSIFATVLQGAVSETVRLRAEDRGRLQRTLANLVCDLIADAAEGAQEESGLATARLRARAMSYVDDNLASIRDVAEIADAAECTVRRLYEAFRERGTTPARYLWGRRLKLAKMRIRAGSTSLTETAYACGFQSYAHFSRAYKRAFGVAPTESRRVH